MTANEAALDHRKPLRTWPLLAIAALYAVAIVIGPFVLEDFPMVMFGGVAAAVLVVLWWLLFSRSRLIERLGVLALFGLAVAVTKSGVDPSIAGGAQGFLAYILGVAFYALALAVWAIATGRLPERTRAIALIPVFIIVGAVPLLAIRTEGVMGGGFVLHWRWTPTAEELLLARGDEEPKPVAAAIPPPAPEAAAPPQSATPELKSATPENESVAAPDVPAAPAPTAVLIPAEWPGFRGPNRDGVIRALQIKTDWTQTPPVEIWRRPVGPGWSSFAIRGDLLYTQEQRGDFEMVSCYRVSTGEPVWRHRDPIRFYESNGGAGPRGTPTIHGTRVFAMGATGMLNAIDATSGKLLWSQNVAADTNREIPMWGISSSPLVIDDVVIVSLYGTLAGYDVETGKRRWLGPIHGGSYSSPHLLTVDGVPHVIILSAPGAVAVHPSDGKLLWEHRWGGGAIVQPAITEDGDVLINAMAATGGLGTRRLAITRDGDGWKVEERWTTNGLKPYFNDLVIHKGHAYGFDGAILSSIDLSDGRRKWKGGRYGNGQMILLADQDLLLVISEEGELALVSATPDQYNEIAKFPALNAKTWNHPVIVRDLLLVRNGEEMVAYRLPIAQPAATDRER